MPKLKKRNCETTFKTLFNKWNTNKWKPDKKNKKYYFNKKIALEPVRVKGEMNLRIGMWHGLRNDIIMRNVMENGPKK